MNHPTTYPKDWVALLLILCSAIITVSLLRGCPGSGEGSIDTGTAAASQASRFSGTNTPYSETTYTPNGKDDFNTRVAHHWAAVATEVALSPRATIPSKPFY